MPLPSAVPVVQALAQALLAALGPSQNQRLLRLHTPLGPQMLLAERMHGVESIGPRAPGATGDAGFKFDVLALSTSAHLKLKDLIGQPVRLDLLTQQSRLQLRPYHGHVTQLALLGSDGGLARYKVTIEPWFSFLRHTEDSYVFQDMTVMEIIDKVFSRYKAQGRLAPAWRWDLADASVYPKRSLCVQFAESDFDFVTRLLAEEGLFYWFEHQAAEGDTLGVHTMAIGDHNGCFKPNAQPTARFTQSAAASFREDSLTQFSQRSHLKPTSLATASFDYRSVQQIAAQPNGADALGSHGLQLTRRDQPGAYAYETNEQASRIATRQLEALQAPGYQSRALGSLRQAACATTFQLGEHPSVDAAIQWVILAVESKARNNITADLATGLHRLLGAVPTSFVTATGSDMPATAKPSLFKGTANDSPEPLYQSQLLLQDINIPVRAASCVNLRGDIIFKRPQIFGAQTAQVVGLGEPIHTDRDNRIKIQFHWQRGVNSSHRLEHPDASNAPADAGAGTWVRVSQAWAGANWGAHHTPRLGQEVVVTFVEGDVDRPVVVGSVYNGQGQQDAQGNEVAAGAAGATGNAGAWFPGNQKAGEYEGHQHPHVLAGFKSQSLDTSQAGTGGFNQLVFDDSPGQARVTLSSTSANTHLQIGHLLRQSDNQRLAKRGHGIDLCTDAHGALRAASGLILTTYTRPGGTNQGVMASDAAAAVAQLTQSAELAMALADTAQKHNAKLDGEPAAKDLPDQVRKQSLIESQSQSDSRGGSEPAPVERGQDTVPAVGGGSGTVPAPSRPDLLLHGEGGVFVGTPMHSVWAAGATLGVSAGQDLNVTAGRHMALAVKNGIAVFSHGKASSSGKPNQETGIQLHAASGNLSVAAQGSTVSLTADKSVTVSSTTDAITGGSPKRVKLVAGGSSLDITTGSITITTSGAAQFKASMKELTGAGSASASLSMPKPGDLKGCAMKLSAATQTGAAGVPR